MADSGNTYKRQSKSCVLLFFFAALRRQDITSFYFLVKTVNPSEMMKILLNDMSRSRGGLKRSTATVQTCLNTCGAKQRNGFGIPSFQQIRFTAYIFNFLHPFSVETRLEIGNLPTHLLEL